MYLLQALISAMARQSSGDEGAACWRNSGPLYGAGVHPPRSVTRAALLVFALTNFWPGRGISANVNLVRVASAYPLTA
jgi:hypothetical protein